MGGSLSGGAPGRFGSRLPSKAFGVCSPPFLVSRDLPPGGGVYLRPWVGVPDLPPGSKGSLTRRITPQQEAPVIPSPSRPMWPGSRLWTPPSMTATARSTSGRSAPKSLRSAKLVYVVGNISIFCFVFEVLFDFDFAPVLSVFPFSYGGFRVFYC